MGLLDFFKKEQRDTIKKKQRDIERGVFEFTITKEVQELIAKGQSLTKLGRNKEASERFNQAIEIAKRGIEKYPDYIGFKLILCGIYLEIGAYDVAYESFRLIVQEYSQDPNVDLTEVYTRLGVISWYKKKNIPQALEYLNMALKAPLPTDVDFHPSAAVKSEPHIYLAQIYLESGDKQRAAYHARARLEIVKDCPMAGMISNMLAAKS